MTVATSVRRAGGMPASALNAVEREPHWNHSAPCAPGPSRRKLEDLGVRDALSEVEAAVAVAVLVHDQRGDGDGREHLADVGLHQHAQEPGGGAGTGGETLVVHIPVLELRVADVAREVFA